MVQDDGFSSPEVMFMVAIMCCVAGGLYWLINQAKLTLTPLAGTGTCTTCGHGTRKDLQKDLQSENDLLRKIAILESEKLVLEKELINEKESRLHFAERVAKTKINPEGSKSFQFSNPNPKVVYIAGKTGTCWHLDMHCHYLRGSDLRHMTACPHCAV